MSGHDLASEVFRFAFVTVALLAVVAVLSASACAPKTDRNVWRELTDEGVIR